MGFMDIAAAKEVLTDEEMRQKYDQGEDPLDPESGRDGGGHPFGRGGHQHFHFPGGNPFGGDGNFQFKFHFNSALAQQGIQTEYGITSCYLDIVIRASLISEPSLLSIVLK